MTPPRPVHKNEKASAGGARARGPLELRRLVFGDEKDELERFGEADMLELAGGGKTLDGSWMFLASPGS